MDLGLVLQIVACAVTLAAAWLIGNKHVAGPALNVVAAICFAVLNAYAGLWVASGFSASMAFVNFRSFLRWRLTTSAVPGTSDPRGGAAR